MKTKLPIIFLIMITVFLYSCNNPVTTPTNQNTTDSDSDPISNTPNDKEKLYNEVLCLISGNVFKESLWSGYGEFDSIDWLNPNNTIEYKNNNIIVNYESYNKTFSFTPFDIKNINSSNDGYKVYNIEMESGILFTIYAQYYTGISYKDNNSLIFNSYKSFTVDSNSTENTGGTSVTDIENFIQGNWDYSAKFDNSSKAAKVNFNKGNITVTSEGNTYKATYVLSNGKINITYNGVIEHSTQSFEYKDSFNIELGSNSFRIYANSSSPDVLQIWSQLFRNTTSSIPNTVEINFTK